MGRKRGGITYSQVLICAPNWPEFVRWGPFSHSDLTYSSFPASVAAGARNSLPEVQRLSLVVDTIFWPAIFLVDLSHIFDIASGPLEALLTCSSERI